MVALILNWPNNKDMANMLSFRSKWQENNCTLKNPSISHRCVLRLWRDMDLEMLHSKGSARDGRHHCCIGSSLAMDAMWRSDRYRIMPSRRRAIRSPCWTWASSSGGPVGISLENRGWAGSPNRSCKRNFMILLEILLEIHFNSMTLWWAITPNYPFDLVAKSPLGSELLYQALYKTSYMKTPVQDCVSA